MALGLSYKEDNFLLFMTSYYVKWHHKVRHLDLAILDFTNQSVTKFNGSNSDWIAVTDRNDWNQRGHLVPLS